MEVLDFSYVLALTFIILNALYHNVWIYITVSIVTVGYVFLKSRRKENSCIIPGRFQGVVITGCDTGIGHATALRLHKLGFTIFAGCLDASSEGAKRLRAASRGNLHVLQLDVSKNESVDQALTFVTKHCPEQGLLAVVNNAAINIMVDVELATIDMYKRVADVNIFGMIRVTKAFAPLIRKYKGRFVNITSVKGRMACPLDSTYIITKWAGEAFSDILRREMRRFGVQVVIVEPGDFGGLTGMLSPQTITRMESDLNQAWKLASLDVKNAYGREYIDELVNGIKTAGSLCASSLDPVIDAMVDAVTNENPQYRYLIDGSNKSFDKFCVFARLHPFLPEAVWDYLYPIFFPLPKVKHQRYREHIDGVLPKYRNCSFHKLLLRYFGRTPSMYHFLVNSMTLSHTTCFAKRAR